MRIKLIILLIIFTSALQIIAQPCRVAQVLTPLQELQISTIVSRLDTVLKYENLFQIDSLSEEMKNAYGIQGGIPDAIENGITLDTTVKWLNVEDALILSRILIDKDSIVYADLWKTAKGMKPPLYQPHSIFLRASAEIASGLLKIAEKETDLARKARYQLWATRALDSLATMQLINGAFPFPDLRIYSDPTFTSIIQNFLNFCGPDSINVLKNGWIVDDKELGEFKFDAGVIANAYYEAYQITGNIKYKNITQALGNYLKPLKFNLNYNYNTFVSLGLSRAYQLTNDTSYLNRAIKNIRYCVYPGQISNGRWVDGHNANSRYHSIIIQNIVPTCTHIFATNIYKNTIDVMTYKAVKNFVDYEYTCGSATGYRWLLKAYSLDATIIPETLKDSISKLIGQHINQSAKNGKFLDIPTMGEYIELLGVSANLTYPNLLPESGITIFPNPTSDFITIQRETESDYEVIQIINSTGQLIYNYQNFVGKIIDIRQLNNGIYFLKYSNSKSISILKFAISH